MQEKNKQLLMDGWQLRLIWWWARVDWRGAGCPRHPPSLNLQTQHLKTSRNLLPGGPPPHYLKICSVIQNIWKCVLNQPASGLPSCLPSFNSRHLFSSFTSDFIECNLLIQISEEQPNRTSFSFSKSKHLKGQQTNFFFSISVYPFSLPSFLSLVNVYENVLPPYEHVFI